MPPVFVVAHFSSSCSFEMKSASRTGAGAPKTDLNVCSKATASSRTVTVRRKARDPKVVGSSSSSSSNATVTSRMVTVTSRALSKVRVIVMATVRKKALNKVRMIVLAATAKRLVQK